MQVLGRGAAAAASDGKRRRQQPRPQPALQVLTPACRPAAAKIRPSRASGRDSIGAGLRAGGMGAASSRRALVGRADSRLESVEKSESR